MKDLDLTTLRLFVEVCDVQSIKRVAEREQVDASSITKRMAKLEDQLNTQLLKRVRQGVQATPEGALLSEHARRLVKDAQKISDKAESLSSHIDDLIEKNQNQEMINALNRTSQLHLNLLNALGIDTEIRTKFENLMNNNKKKQ